MLFLRYANDYQVKSLCDTLMELQEYDADFVEHTNPEVANYADFIRPGVHLCVMEPELGGIPQDVNWQDSFSCLPSTIIAGLCMCLETLVFSPMLDFQSCL